jgi:enoyl-CoA hydratase/carnithine racemase
VRIGLVPGDGGAWLLPRIVGTSTALRLLWSGDFIDAEEAARIGLVESVCDDDQLADAVRELAERLAQKPPVVVEMIKRAVRHGATTDLRTSLDEVSSHMAVVTSTEDYQEAVAAFSEHRTGNFQGR